MHLWLDSVTQMNTTKYHVPRGKKIHLTLFIPYKLWAVPSSRNAMGTLNYRAFALVVIQAIKVNFWLACINTAPITDLRHCKELDEWGICKADS